MMTTTAAKDRITTGIELAAGDLNVCPQQLIAVLKRYGIVETVSSLTLCRTADHVLGRAHRFPEQHVVRSELVSLATALLKQATSTTQPKTSKTTEATNHDHH